MSTVVRLTRHPNLDMQRPTHVKAAPKVSHLYRLSVRRETPPRSTHLPPRPSTQTPAAAALPTSRKRTCAIKAEIGASPSLPMASVGNIRGSRLVVSRFEIPLDQISQASRSGNSPERGNVIGRSVTRGMLYVFPDAASCL